MNKYQNAMEIIKENIFKVNSSEEEKAQTHSDHLIGVNQSIMRKVQSSVPSTGGEFISPIIFSTTVNVIQSEYDKLISNI